MTTTTEPPATAPTATPPGVAPTAPPGVEGTAPPGLKGLVVAETSIGEVRGAEGFYHYRGVPATELARSTPLTDVWALLVDGHLPDRTGGFAATVGELRRVPDRVLDVVTSVADAPPLVALRVGLAALGADARPVIDLDEPQRRHDALRFAAAVPTLVAAHHRAAQGAAPVAPDPTLSPPVDYLRMISGATPDEGSAAAVETYLIATLDHGFNASTFTARVVTSTGADIASAVVAAIGALSGPLHGGAPSRVLDMLDEIRAAVDTAAWVRDSLAAGRRIMGFGHAVYREVDPRSALLREVAEGLGGERIATAVEAERRILDVLAAEKSGRRFATNVEYYSAVALEAAGVPRELFTPTFVVSRVIGWTAHVLEQARDPRIVRPSSRYVGPPPG